MPMIATTIMSSISVKPPRRLPWNMALSILVSRRREGRASGLPALRHAQELELALTVSLRAGAHRIQQVLHVRPGVEGAVRIASDGEAGGGLPRRSRRVDVGEVREGRVAVEVAHRSRSKLAGHGRHVVDAVDEEDLTFGRPAEL